MYKIDPREPCAPGACGSQHPVVTETFRVITALCVTMCEACIVGMTSGCTLALTLSELSTSFCTAL